MLPGTLSVGHGRVVPRTHRRPGPRTTSTSRGSPGVMRSTRRWHEAASSTGSPAIVRMRSPTSIPLAAADDSGCTSTTRMPGRSSSSSARRTPKNTRRPRPGRSSVAIMFVPPQTNRHGLRWSEARHLRRDGQEPTLAPVGVMLVGRRSSARWCRRCRYTRGPGRGQRTGRSGRSSLSRRTTNTFAREASACDRHSSARDRGRDQNNREVRKKYWWRFGEVAPALYGAIRPLDRCLVTCIVSKHLIFSFQPTNRVFSHKIFTFPLSKFSAFSTLQSRIHS